MNREQQIKEMEDKLLNAVKEVEDVRDSLDELKNNTKDVIMVPDNIHLCDGSGILFNNDKQYLWWNNDYQVYKVGIGHRAYSKPHKLIPAVNHALEDGIVYYYSNCGLENVCNINCYGIYDSINNCLWYIRDNNTIHEINPESYSTIMQAIPLEDE